MHRYVLMLFEAILPNSTKFFDGYKKQGLSLPQVNQKS